MINLYKMLKYKSGKAITTAFGKANKKDVAEKFKPYEKLEYVDCVQILETIGEFLPKTKQSLVAELLDEYQSKVANGQVAKEIKVTKKLDIAPPPVVVYECEEQVFYLNEELERIGFAKRKYMDYPSVYLRFLRAIGHDKIHAMCNKFIETKLQEEFKTLTNRQAKESLEYFEYKMDFVTLLFTVPHLIESFDKLHIDELIHIYKGFLNHSFALGFAEERLNELKEQKRSIEIMLEKKSKES